MRPWSSQGWSASYMGWSIIYCHPIPGMGYSICFCWDGPYLLKVSGVLDLPHCWLKISLFAAPLQVEMDICMQLTQK